MIEREDDKKEVNRKGENEKDKNYTRGRNSQ